MKILLTNIVFLLLSSAINATPVIYTNEATYLADLATIDGLTVHESFENETVWADSRYSIVNPESAPFITSQGLMWTSNYSSNDIVTAYFHGDAPDGEYGIYSFAHGLTTDSGLYCDSAEDPDIPLQCYQNDGLKVEVEAGGTLYAFGGRIETSYGGKVTFLLDGKDVNGNVTDNIDNWQREGDSADNWTFVGVIDTDGFWSVELKELKGKDYQQVLLFADDFTIHRSADPALLGDFNDDGIVDAADYTVWRDNSGAIENGLILSGNGNGNVVDETDYVLWRDRYGDTNIAATTATTIPEPNGILLLTMGLLFLQVKKQSFADSDRIRSNSKSF